MSKKLAIDEEIEAWGLRHAVRISSVSDMRAAFDDAATLHMVTTPTLAAQIEALTKELEDVEAELSELVYKKSDHMSVSVRNTIVIRARLLRAALSNTGKP